MGKIKLVDINKIMMASELIKDSNVSPEYQKLLDEANERIKKNHIEEAKAYISARNYIAKSKKLSI